jgi:hypothetical protein
MKRVLIVLFIFLSGSVFANTNTRRVKNIVEALKEAKRTTATDSFEVEKYIINLDMRDFAAQTIKGYTDVLVTVKANGLGTIKLDLLKLTVTQVSINNTPLQYVYTDTALHILLGKTYNAADTFTVRIEYEGKPQADKTWGGFYFSGVYGYNLGVGFDASPHNFGRVWFPCVDKFTSRSLYEFIITTEATKRAMCNGTLINTINNFDGSITWRWQLNSRIPTYLASVAVAPYEVVNDNYSSVNGNTPITLAALAGDTAKMKASFVHLKKAFEGYEKTYGPHRFERVGFNAVPFNGGAMEHATNIAYPLFAIDGTLSQETLYAHEFAHHWWGDNTTCRTQEDMWLNEGWASYSEKLFLEYVYGYDRYSDAIMDNHYEVVRWAHLRDGQPWAISGIPHDYTYGVHVYKKGADVVHNLRSYMGKGPFADAVKEFQETYKYSDVSSDDLKKVLAKHTVPSLNMNDFFDSWVYGVGFPAFSGYLLNVTPGPGSNYQCTLRVHQQLRFTNKPFKACLVDVSFMPKNDKSTNKWTWNFVMTNTDTVVVMQVPFEPTAVYIDRFNSINDAVTENEFWIKNSTTYNFNYANFSITTNANSIADSNLVRVEQHWTKPFESPIPYPNLYTSESRYWRVFGQWADSLLNATAAIVYDGTTPAGFTSGWLDNDLIRITEDSLVLLYRPDARSAWQIYPYYQKTMGNVKDKRGTITLQKIKQGDYVLGMYDRALGTNPAPLSPDRGKLEIYPNPTSGQVKIEFDDVYKAGTIQITDNTGRSVETIAIYPGQNFVQVDTHNWQTGIYYVSINKAACKKLVISR